MWNSKALLVVAALAGCSSGPTKEQNAATQTNSNTSPNNAANVIANNLVSGPTYVAGATYTLGEEPRTPVVANLDGNAFADVVVVNQFSADTQFLLGDGTGEFAVDGDAIERAVAVLAADFDDDGVDDIAISTDEVRVVVVLDPVGTPFRLTLDVPALPDGLAAADFDGDGDIDLAVSIAGTLNEPGASVAIFPWGDATFGPETLASVGLQPRKLAAVDGDIIVMLGLKSALRLENNGSGGFAASAPFGLGDGVLEFTTVDLDQSGTIDVLAADLSGGAITAAVNVPNEDAATLTEVAAPFGITTFHANDDGVLDVAVTSVDDESVVGLVSTPDGTYAKTTIVDLAGAIRLGGLAAADLNGDGLDDLLIVERNRDQTGTLHVFLSAP